MDKRVLIIEDEIDMQEAIADALTSRGLGVLTANNGEEGLALALKEQPDLIILDLYMPKMGGQEMLQKLRQDPWGKNVKVLILTAMDDVENIGHGYEKGIADYVIKSSVNLADIITKVQTELHSK